MSSESDALYETLSAPWHKYERYKPHYDLSHMAVSHLATSDGDTEYYTVACIDDCKFDAVDREKPRKIARKHGYAFNANLPDYICTCGCAVFYVARTAGKLTLVCGHCRAAEEQYSG